MGVHVPLGLRAHPPPRRRGASASRRSFTIYDQADAVRLTGYVLRDLNLDPKKFPPRGVHAAISRPRTTLLERRGVRRAGAGRSSSARSPRSTASTRPACSRPAPWTSTTCCRTRSSCSSAHPDVLEHYQQRFKHVLVDEYQDTNTVQNELVLLLAAGAPQRLRRRRRRPVDLPLPRRRHPQHPRVRGRVPRRHGRRARAELPVDADDPRRRQRGHRQQPRAASRRSCGPTRARRHASSATTPTTSSDEAQWVAARDRPQLHDGGDAPLGRHRRLLPDQRPEPGARGALMRVGHPVQGRRRHPLLRPTRDQGRPRLPAGGRRTRPTRCRSSGSSTCPSAGVGDTSVGQLDAFAARATASRSSRRCARADEAGVTGPGRQGHRATSCDLLDELASCCRRRARRRCSRRRSSAAATSTSSRPSTPIEAEGRIENLAELVGSAPGVRRRRRVPRAGQPRGRHRRARRRRVARSCS